MSEKYFIKTFGCQMNVYDSLRIADMLKKEGYEETLKQNEADIVLFNTCHIREKAAEKLFSDLGRAHLIEDEQIVKRAPFVDFAVGPLMYHTIPDILKRVKADKEHQCEIKTDFPAISKFDYLPENTAKGGCSFLAIQEGCNNFCTYCVVPYTRGSLYQRCRIFPSDCRSFERSTKISQNRYS